jgi:hypothetical protein
LLSEDALNRFAPSLMESPKNLTKWFAALSLKVQTLIGVSAISPLNFLESLHDQLSAAMKAH